MKAKYRSLLAAVLALGFTVPAQADGGATSSVPAAAPVVEGRQAVLTAQVVYQVLLAEIALQRGNAELAAQAYAALALRTRDPGVLERTVEVAGHARRFDLAREAVQLWLQVDPESAKAQRMMSSVLLMSNRLEEMAPHLVRMLELDKAALPENLLGLNRMLARNPDRQAVFRLIDRVCAPFFGLAEAHYAVAMAAASAGEQARARAEIQRALELRPDWEMAALLAAQIEARD
ncbi:MAG: pilus assembly protein TadD, partial [Proteobacteria bacterium]|nr:pilus assembly protein TadD [Pseudomonadota bacterium]